MVNDYKTDCSLSQLKMCINIHPDLFCILGKKIIMVISSHFRGLSLLCSILMSDLRNTALNLGKKEDQLRRKRPF